MLFVVSGYRSLRRAMERDQKRIASVRLPLWRLLLEEIVLLVRRVGRWRVWGAAAVVAAAVFVTELALSDTTPGPSLAVGWRAAVALAVSTAALAAWACVHAMRRVQTRIGEE